MNIQSTLNEHVDLESNATSTICAEEVEEQSPVSRPDDLESRLNEDVVKIELGLDFFRFTVFLFPYYLD